MQVGEKELKKTRVGVVATPSAHARNSLFKATRKSYDKAFLEA